MARKFVSTIRERHVMPKFQNILGGKLCGIGTFVPHNLLLGRNWSIQLGVALSLGKIKKKRQWPHTEWVKKFKTRVVHTDSVYYESSNWRYDYAKISKVSYADMVKRNHNCVTTTHNSVPLGSKISNNTVSKPKVNNFITSTSSHVSKRDKCVSRSVKSISLLSQKDDHIFAKINLMF